MWSKRLLSLLLCLLLLCSLAAVLAEETGESPTAEAGTAADTETETGADAEAGTELQPPAATLQLQLCNERHTPYIRGYGDGTVRPEGVLTLAEGCQLFYGLLRTRPADRAEVPGVEKGIWYYDAMSLLAAGGILDLQRDGPAVPEEALNRGRFILMLTRFFPELEEGDCSFPDVPRSSLIWSAVAKATAKGWIKGFEDGTFRPESPLTRAQAAAVLNRVMGREADEETLAEKLVLPLFTDLSPDYWAYGTMLEAAIDHSAENAGEKETWTEILDERLRFDPGPVLTGGETYWADEEGWLQRDLTVGNLYFGADGRYTCGDAEADAYVHDILAGLYDPALTRLELLRAAFEYTRDSFAYLRRTESYDYGATGWEVEEALTMLRTGRGNCYCYAGVFCLLARQLGYDARAIAGGSNWTPRPHAWVEIDFDGVSYIFDTELEMAKKGQYNFWMITPAELPWPYWRDEKTMLYGAQ